MCPRPDQLQDLNPSAKVIGPRRDQSKSFFGPGPRILNEATRMLWWEVVNAGCWVAMFTAV